MSLARALSNAIGGGLTTGGTDIYKDGNGNDRSNEAYRSYDANRNNKSRGSLQRRAWRRLRRYRDYRGESRAGEPQKGVSQF
jgi:hypothetical protein